MKEIIADKLKQFRADRNVDKNRIATYLNISERTYTRWENQETMPDLETLVKLSEFFGCTVDDLVKADTPADYVSRELVICFKDIVNSGFNASLAHGLVKEVLTTVSHDRIPKVCEGQQVNYVFKDDVKKVIEKMLEKLI